MVEFSERLIDATSQFSLSEALVLLKPLTLFIIGMGIYAWFIFKFYRFVAKRELFKVDFGKYEGKEGSGVKKFFHGFFYIVKYVILFPLLTFFWVVVLSIILAFLSKTTNMDSILLVSMALVGIIRIMSYYNEDLSKDLAKMLPFALLGVFLVDISYFSISDSVAAISQLPLLWKSAVYYLGFIIALEFLLRLFSGIFPDKKGKVKVED
jgi:hypothetical protein